MPNIGPSFFFIVVSPLEEGIVDRFYRQIKTFIDRIALAREPFENRRTRIEFIRPFYRPFFHVSRFQNASIDWHSFESFFVANSFFFPRDRSSKQFFIYPWKLPAYLIVLFILIFHPIKLTIPLKRINLSNKNFLPNTYFQPIIKRDSSKTCTLQNCIIIEKEVTVSKRKGNQVSHQLPRLSRSPRTDTDLTHHHPFFAVPRHLALRDSPIVRAIIIVQVPR